MKFPILAALAALALCALPAQSQERIVKKTDLLDAEIVLSKAAESHPALIEFLRNDATGELADMESLARDMKADLGANFHTFTLRLTDDDRFAGGGFVSILRTIGTYTGGAHGNQLLDPLTWDVSAKRFVRLDFFLQSGAPQRRALEAISKTLRAALAAKHGPKQYEGFKDDVLMATMPDVTVMQNFTLEPSTVPGRVGGLAFHYSPYEVGPYSMGPVSVMVPNAVFAAGLKPQFKSLFEGSPAR